MKVDRLLCAVLKVNTKSVWADYLKRVDFVDRVRHTILPQGLDGRRLTPRL